MAARSEKQFLHSRAALFIIQNILHFARAPAAAAPFAIVGAKVVHYGSATDSAYYENAKLKRERRLSKGFIQEKFITNAARDK